jgi:methanogenic corrinoid protein MtbC1
MTNDSMPLKNFIQNLLEGDRQKSSAFAHKFLASGHSVMDLYEHVFKPALYEIGRLWETNQISVAAEHLATAITEGILNELFEQIVSEQKKPQRVVVAGVENEHHQVGMKMVADVFEMKGWESFFLGTGIPVSELIRFIRRIKPDLVAISLSVYFNFANLLKMLEELKRAYPDLQIILGGQAFSHLSPEARLSLGSVEIITDLYSLEAYIDALNPNPKI